MNLKFISSHFEVAYTRGGFGLYHKLNSRLVFRFRMLSELVEDCVPVYQSIYFNRKCWSKMADLLQSGELIKPEMGNLDILCDKTIEQNVLDAVAADEAKKSQEAPVPKKTSS